MDNRYFIKLDEENKIILRTSTFREIEGAVEISFEEYKKCFEYENFDLQKRQFLNEKVKEEENNKDSKNNMYNNKDIMLKIDSLEEKIDLIIKKLR